MNRSEWGSCGLGLSFRQNFWSSLFLVSASMIMSACLVFGKFYFDDIPELKATRIHCSKDGWLLFSQLSDVMFLFNPFTDSFIDLPNYIIYRYSLRVALSCAPTSPDSIIFAIGIGTEDGYGGVLIGIFQSGDARWTTLNYQNTDGVKFRCGVGPVFCNGLFYCLSEFHDKLVGVFDPQKHTWSILPVPPPNLPPMQFRAIHMVEVKGELLLVFVSYPNKTLIFKLDLSEMKWVETESLNGATVFVSSHSSLSATDAPRISRNSVYFSKYRCYGKSSYFYSFDDCRFHPANQRHEVPGIEKAIWIEPPKMSHLLFEELY
ncbi:hypothetical protein NE237_000828 [Protea cynaroides]|uniref:KIB1-4 beta-propeller domain-containing protein n=1 Tax=Protea cynaroides TaxID=273540 RepID=A0A9Q0KS56_9MAGN|nr:hypothetical protein NE237_000828 [Protea cynaroides]